jgi:hypothetical protein
MTSTIRGFQRIIPFGGMFFTGSAAKHGRLLVPRIATPTTQGRIRPGGLEGRLRLPKKQHGSR